METKEITGYQYGCYFFPVTKAKGSGKITGLCNVKYKDEEALLKDYDACSPKVKLERCYSDGSKEILREWY